MRHGIMVICTEEWVSYSSKNNTFFTLKITVESGNVFLLNTTTTWLFGEQKLLVYVSDGKVYKVILECLVVFGNFKV